LKRLDQLQVLIVGLGQIGGSIGLDLVGNRSVARVVGYDQNSSQSARAKRHRAVDLVARSLRDGISESDVVILATPTNGIIETLPLVCRDLKPGAVVLDVGSTKSAVLEVASRVCRKANFIGGHPIAGNEGHGFRSARRDQFLGTTFALIPSRGASTASLSLVKRLVRNLGASPLVVTARKHDRLTALTIGIPNALAVVLMALAREAGVSDPEIWKLTGGSFRGATRVSSSSPDLIAQMLSTNRSEIVHALDLLIAGLAELKAAASGGDERAILAFVRRARPAAEVKRHAAD
jgi:prephenate dehydrogenase